MAVLADLMLLLRANSADLQKGLDTAKKGMTDVNKKTSELQKGMSTAFSSIAKSIDSIIPGFSGLTSGIGKAISSVGTFSKALGVMKTAIISTGIGALVIALGSLISYFKNTAEGADKFNIALNGIKAVVSTVLKTINKLGEAIVKLLKGDFKGAADAAKEAFTGLGKEVKTAFQSGLDVGKRLEALEDRRNQLIITEADIRKKVADLELIAFDKSKKTTERQAALNELIKLEKQLADEKLAIETEAYNIMLQQNKTREVTDDIVNQTNTAYATMVGVQQEHSEILRQTVRLQNRLTEEIKKETEERQKAKAEADAALKLEQEKIANTQFATNIKANIQLPKLTGLDLGKQQPIIAPPPVPPTTISSWVQLGETMTTVGETTTNLANAFGALSNTIKSASEDGKISFVDAMNIIGQTAMTAISILGALAAAEIISKEASKGLIGIATAIAGVAALVAIWAAFVTPSKFAKGGIVTGPTLGLVGEYPGARNNPEVIAPLDKLQKYMGPANGMKIEVEGKIYGRDLALVLRRADRIN